MERRDTEIVRDDVTGTVREESHVTRDAGGGGVMDSAEVVSSATPARRATEVIYLVFGIIYGLTDVFLAPFRNLLPTVGGGSGAVLEMSTVIAIIVYALIGWALVRLVAITFFRNVTVSRRSSRGISGPRVD
jgi:uncharacterized protein YggT (Ycf19 family)